MNKGCFNNEINKLMTFLLMWLYNQPFRACSHELRTVNYRRVMTAQGQALPRIHMMIRCPGATLPRVNFIAYIINFIANIIWSLQIYLNSFSFYTNCYRKWILNTFIYFWCFLELFIENFFENINKEHAQDYSCPGAIFAFCSHGEKLPVTRLSKLPRGNEKLM